MTGPAAPIPRYCPVQGSITRYLRPEVISRIARLDVQARCIAEGFLSGLHRSPYHGFSTEFSEHRKYTEGDDLRHIDWNVFARTDRLYLKKFEAQTNLECTLLVDVSASMAYRHRQSSVSKLEYAICLAAAMSYLMIRQRDVVGLVTFDDRLQAYVRPNGNSAQLSRLLGVLAEARTTGRTRFAGAFPALGQLVRHRGLVLLFSDFLGDLDAAAAGLQQLRFRGHDVIVFHILDRAEVTLPFEGASLFVDSEDPALRVSAQADLIRREYDAEIAGFREQVRQACVDTGAEHLALDTSQPFDVALARFLKERQMRF